MDDNSLLQGATSHHTVSYEWKTCSRSLRGG